MNPIPLGNIKVVELSTYVAAPSCARMLADMGAKVVKIEAFRGDPWRYTSMATTYTDENEIPMFDIYNAGKESICLDIKNPVGMKILMEMLETADVFVTNTRPASLKKQGLDYDSLKEKFPRLIYATVTGYGEKGPEADKPGFDNVAFWTRSGFLRDMAIDAPGSYPVASPTGAGDSNTGALLFGGVVTALYQREFTGKGDYITVALYNAGIWMLGSMICSSNPKYGISYPKKRSECSPFATIYRCADDEWVSVTILDYLRYRDIAFNLLGVAEEFGKQNIDVSTLANLKKNSDRVIPILEAAFLKKTAAEWDKLFNEADLVCSRLTHMTDVHHNEQARVNGFVQDYTFRNGETAVLPCPPIRMASQPPARSDYAPLAGENTDKVLADMGYSAEKIAELKAMGAVK